MASVSVGVGERLSVGLEPLDACLGVACQDDDVAFAERLVVELAGNGAHAGGRHDVVIGVPGQHADARLRIAAGKLPPMRPRPTMPAHLGPPWLTRAFLTVPMGYS